MKILTLALKRQYFNEIVSGQKVEEFRVASTFWRKRIEGKTFDRIVLTMGYPPNDDLLRRIERKWNGYQLRMITHPEFGSEPVLVFAIDVSQRI